MVSCTVCWCIVSSSELQSIRYMVILVRFQQSAVKVIIKLEHLSYEEKLRARAVYAREEKTQGVISSIRTNI